MLISAQGEAIATPEGFFIGEHAAAYGDAVVGEAWQTPITQTDAAVELPWPATLSDAVHEQLSRGIDVIAADSSSLEQHQDAGPLLQRAQLLVDDADLMADAASGQSLDEAVKAKAQRILAVGRQNVTSLQARVGGMSEREERLYWRSIIRPIPRISSPAAKAARSSMRGLSNSSMPVSRMKRYWHMKPNQVCRIQVRMRDSFPGKPCWPIWPNGSGNAASHPHGSPLSHSPRLNNPHPPYPPPPPLP